MTPNELREARLRLGLTQAQFADALHVWTNTVSRWELGTRPVPRSLFLALEALQARDAKEPA